MCADNHTNFFTMPVMLTIEVLTPYVSVSTSQAWLARAAKIDPAIYRGLTTNWGLVAAGGEFIRYQHGLSTLAWVEERLSEQVPQFDDNGLFLDPTPLSNPPMPYDIFPRHYLEMMLWRGYNGTYKALLTELLGRASATSLLMQSPWGELSTGGRSSQHQWNEAVQCMLYEMRARIFKDAGNSVVARAFKRAARLAHSSLRRWIKPTGELWIIKNRFNPAERFGYQDYSFVSNYNNLPASMLAMAYLLADDTITEGPSVAEVGGVVFEVPSHHKIFANIQGTYLELETCADPEYDATGLTRVHYPSIEPMVGPTAGSPIQNRARAIGVGWRKGNVEESLANFGYGSMVGIGKLDVVHMGSSQLSFNVTYTLSKSLAGVTTVVESYTVVSGEATITAMVSEPVDNVDIIFPAFLFDGQRNFTVSSSGKQARVGYSGTCQTFTVLSDTADVVYIDDQVQARNGYMGRFTANVAHNGSVQYSVQPQQC
jgi:hypothetical protein